MPGRTRATHHQTLWPVFGLALGLVLGASFHGARGAGPEACLDSQIPTNQLFCLSEAAKEAGDVAVCLLSDQTGVRFQCISLYAEHARDPALCDKIPMDATDPDGVLRETCRVHLAVSWMQPELCEGLKTPNLADSCYVQLVAAGADAALCARIENDLLKPACGGEQ